MTITAIETLRLDEFPNLLWVLVEDEAGVKGLGETFFGARAVDPGGPLRPPLSFW